MGLPKTDLQTNPAKQIRIGVPLQVSAHSPRVDAQPLSGPILGQTAAVRPMCGGDSGIPRHLPSRLHRLRRDHPSRCIRQELWVAARLKRASQVGRQI